MKTAERVLRFLARKIGLKKWLQELKQPKMIWGYQSLNGTTLPRVRISDTVFMYHKDRINIEDNVFIWHYSILDGTGGLEIGEGTQIGAWVGIFTHSSHLAIRLYGKEYTNIAEAEKKAYPIKGVKIGRYVFIGAGAKIMPGVVIEDYSLISAGTIVKKDIPKYSIVKGNPAKIVGDVRHLDEKYLEEYPELRHSYVVE